MMNDLENAVSAFDEDNQFDDAQAFINSLARSAPMPPATGETRPDPYAEEIASAKRMMGDQAYNNMSWSDWASQAAQTALASGKAILPTALGGHGAIGISDIAKVAAESAISGVTLPGDAALGKVQVFDETGLPTEAMLQRAADFAGLVSVGPVAIPAEANSLRMGAKGVIRSEDITVPAVANNKQLFVQFGNSRFLMDNFRQASIALTKLLEETGGTFSGKTGPKVDTPLIVNADGDVVGYVSQNGKVWAGKPQDWSSDKLLFDPYNELEALEAGSNTTSRQLDGQAKKATSKAKKLSKLKSE